MAIDIFAEGTRAELRFTLPEGSTPSGELTIEQLWKLKPVSVLVNGKREYVEYLKRYEVILEEEVERFGKKSRRERDITTNSTAQKQAELRLAIVSYILDVKDKEASEAKDAVIIKEHNDKIRAVMARKKDDVLEGMSIEELQKLMK